MTQNSDDLFYKPVEDDSWKRIDANYEVIQLGPDKEVVDAY